MKTSKFWLSMIALGSMTLSAAPASAMEAKPVVTAGVTDVSSSPRSQVVLAAMVAGLSALLLLRRHAREKT